MRQFDSQIEEKHYRHLNVPAGDLRISIIANCNMRCHYCHNEGTGPFRPTMLTIADVRDIVRGAQRYGVRKIRLTGGEPLMHPDLAAISEMLREELGVEELGINTNATFAERLESLAARRLLTQIVVGLDRFDSTVSKASPIGASSRSVLATVGRLKRAGQNVQIAAVYDGDYDNMLALANWCLSEGVLLKILEISDEKVASESTPAYAAMFQQLVAALQLRVGMTADLRELYGVAPAGGRILFFHSHCRLRECGECSRLHLRVTATGFAKPCLLRSDTEAPLLGGDFDGNIRRAIHNLGNPPENAPR